MCFCLVRSFGSVSSTFSGIIFSFVGVDRNLRNLSDGGVLDKRENFESSIAATTIVDVDILFDNCLV